MGKRGRPTKAESRLVGLSPDPLPTAAQFALGIDVGVEGFHVSIPDPALDPLSWPVWFISYKDNPRWRDQLIALLGDETICVAEPTGWHYLSPIARVITTQSPARLYLIEHSRTGAVRLSMNITQKTDTNDARALANVAYDLHFKPRAAGAWLFDWNEHESLLELRFLVNAYAKATADKVRFSNRISHLGHSIDPALNIGTAWDTCMSLGVFTPDDILDLSPMLFTASATRSAIVRLQSRLTRGTYVSPTLLGALKEAYSAYALSVSRVKTLTDQIVAFITQSKWAGLYERLMTFPLASPIGCAAIIVASKGVADLMDLKVFKACLGAYPQIKESGKVKKSRAAKRGYRPAMSAIHMWAQALVRESSPDNPVRAYFAGGEKNGGRKFSAAKAKLVRCLHGVAKSVYGHNNALAPQAQPDQQPPAAADQHEQPPVAADQHEQQQPVKRGRGRPRKDQQPPAAADQHEQMPHEQPPARPRFRSLEIDSLTRLSQWQKAHDALTYGTLRSVRCVTSAGSFDVTDPDHLVWSDEDRYAYAWSGDKWIEVDSFSWIEGSQ